MSALARLGRVVGGAAGVGPSDASKARVRARVVALPKSGALGHRQARGALLAIAFCTAIAAIVAVGRYRSLEATSTSGAVSEGDWLTAAQQASLPVEFEDRGKLELKARSRARVSRLSRARVDVALEEGRLDADLVPKSGTAWTIAAGPYQVQVLGTAFDVSWNAERKQLTVLVYRGVVRVVGGALEEHGIELKAGDSLKADAETGQTLLSRQQPAHGAPPALEGKAEVLPAPEAGSEAPTAEALPEAALAPAASAGERHELAVDELRSLARHGKYADAMARAQELGFESLTSTLSGADLVLLADAARYQHRTGQARLALLALRRRFPASSEAATATFLLGRLAAEQGHDYADAAKWFATYLQEHPSGAMAAEALGRRIQVLAQAGDAEGARGAARQYLSLYPLGPYAKAARGVLDGRKLKFEP